MPPKSKDPKLEQAFSFFKEITTPYAKVEDVAKLVMKLVAFVREAKVSIERGNRESFAKVDRDIILFSNKIAKIDQRLNSSRADAVKETERIVKELRKKVDSLENPEIYMAHVEQMIQEVESKIAKPITAEQVRDLLETLKKGSKLEIDAIENLRKELDELKKVKKSSGGGGGMLSLGHWPRHESFTLNGSDTSVTLTQAVAAQGTALIVRYQGQTLDLTTHYTVNGTKITFVGFVPEVDTIISVTYWT